jgi:hypothetical protein
MQVTGAGIAANSVIATIDSPTQITMNNNATATAVVALTFKIAPSVALDFWGFDNAGTLKLEMTAWTNVTTRAVALAADTDVYLVKDGDATRRYIGSCCTTTVAGQTEDNSGVGGLPAQRILWNMYNRVLRSIATTKAGTWIYGAGMRSWGNDVTQRVNLMRGLDEDLVVIDITCGGNSFNATAAIGVGLDVTNALAAGCKSPSTNSPTAGFTTPIVAFYKGYTGAVGFHFYQHIEWTGGANVTFLGQSVGGMSGYTFA